MVLQCPYTPQLNTINPVEIINNLMKQVKYSLKPDSSDAACSKKSLEILIQLEKRHYKSA